MDDKGRYGIFIIPVIIEIRELLTEIDRGFLSLYSLKYYGLPKIYELSKMLKGVRDDLLHIRDYIRLQADITRKENEKK